MANVNYLLNLSSGDVALINKQQGDVYIGIDTDIDKLLTIISDAAVSPRYRFFLLNSDETIQEEIPIEDVLSGGSYSENYQNGQRASLSITLSNNDGKYTPNINKFWIKTKVRFDIGIENDDNSITWVQKGVFVSNASNPSYHPESKTVSFSMSDKFSILEKGEGKLKSTYEIPTGSILSNVVKEILNTQVGDSNVLDPQPPYFHPSLVNKISQAKIVKEAGSTIGSLILDIATHLSAEVFYNSQGRLCFFPLNVVGDDNDKPVLYNYNTTKGELTNLDFSLDYSNVVNKIIIIGATINGGVIRAEAANENVFSPLNVQKIGERVSVINDSNIKTKIIAEENARYQLRQVSILKTSLSITPPFNPLMSVNNLIMITDDFYNLHKQFFLIQSVSFNLDYSNNLNMTISNLENLPFITNYRTSMYENEDEVPGFVPVTVDITVGGGTYSMSPNPFYLNGTGTIILTPNEGASLPSEIIVRGANYTYNPSTGVISLSNISDHVTIVANMVYRVFFTLGDYVQSAYTSTNPETTSGNPSGYRYEYRDNVYCFVKPYEDTIQHHYTCDGELIENSNGFYRIKIIERITENHYELLSNVTQNAQTYTVTFTAGDYTQSPIGAFTSLANNATSGNNSGTYYNYGDRVYYYVNKLPNTAQYTYTCSGTPISGNTYLLGDIIIDEIHYPDLTIGYTFNLGALSSIEPSINSYTVNYNLDNNDYILSYFLSTHSDATSGDASGSSYAYNTTVYYFIERYADDYEWSYSQSGTYIGEGINGGKVYRLGSTTINENTYAGLMPGHVITITGHPNVVRAKKKYAFNFVPGIDLNTAVDPCMWSCDDLSSTDQYRSGHLYDYGTTVYLCYAPAIDNAEWTYTSSGTQIGTNVYCYNSYVIGLNGQDINLGTVSPVSKTKNSYLVTFTKGNYVDTAYISNIQNPEGPSDPRLSPTSTSYNYGTTVYYFVIKESDSSSINYRCDGYQIIGNFYRIGSTTINTTTYPSLQKGDTVNLGTLSNVTAWCKVTFVEGSNIILAFTSTNENATSGNSNAHEYPYGSTVYYFIVLPANTSSVHYRSDGYYTGENAQGFRVYRLGSVNNITQHTNVGALDSIVQYKVEFIAGDYVTDIYSSTVYPASSGNPSGTWYDYATPVYTYIKPYTNQGGYTYDCSYTLTSLNNVYLVDSSNVYSNINLGTISGVTRYGLLTITKGNNIIAINVKIGSASSYTRYTSTYSQNIPTGTSYSWYAEIPTGYSYTYTQSTPYNGTLNDTNVEFNPVATINQYQVTFTAGDYVTDIYCSNVYPPSEADLHVSGDYFDYNTTLYIYLRPYVTNAEYTYTPTGERVGNNLYYYATNSGGEIRPQTFTITSDENLGAISDITRTKNSYEVYFDLGNYVQSAYTSTNSAATSGNPTGTSYPYGTTIYYFITKYTNTAQYTYTCNGTNISGDIYRLGSTTINTSNYPNLVKGDVINLGYLSNVTQTLNNYTLSFSVGNFVSQAFSSVNSNATSGDASGTSYPYGTVVYYFVEKYADDAQYTYTCSGTQISGNIYRIGSTTILNNTNLGPISSTTRSDNYYEVTFSLGDYVQDGYINTNPNATSGFPSGQTIVYGASVYYFVEKYANTTQYNYTCSGVQISGDIYRLGGFTINTENYPNLQKGDIIPIGTISDVTRTVNSYAVSFTYSNDYATNAFVSTNPNITSGDASGTYYDYGTTVYAFVVMKSDNDQYTYTCSGTPISGNIYRVDSVTVDGTENFGDLSAYITRTVKQYTLTINKGTGINIIYYNLYGLSWDSTSSSYSTTLPYGADYSWYATASYGYEYTEYTSSNPCIGTMTGNVSYYPEASLVEYQLSLVAGDYVQANSLYSSTDMYATSGNPTGTSYPMDSTVYMFAKINVDTNQYYYQPNQPTPTQWSESAAQQGDNSGWYLISSTSSYKLYRFDVVTLDNDRTFTLGASRTLRSYSFSITKGAHINAINVKIGSASTYTRYTSSYSTTLDYGTSFKWYAEVASGYSYAYNSDSSACSGTVTGNRSWTAEGLLSLSAPQFQATPGTLWPSGKDYTYYTIRITNPNRTEVQVMYEGFYDTGTEMPSIGPVTTTIPAKPAIGSGNNYITFQVTSTSGDILEAYITAYFQASGYTTTSGTVAFGKDME